MEVYVLKVFMRYFMNNVTTNERIQREGSKDDFQVYGMGPDRNGKIGRDCEFQGEDNGTH